MKASVLFIPFLTGCHLYGGMSIHDTSFDSEFKRERLIATVGVQQALSDNIDIFIEHDSQPTYREDGYGLNRLGVRITSDKLY